jgi:hypothetical protein
MMSGTTLDQEERRAYWAIGLEKALQPLELWKELVELRQQVIF